ncbi:MAG TPA: alpha/beta hydrolase [Hyphomonadaceae bacterium]|nr:alpha/beta hydrolase [Hyphomonadaceae bacterium]
MLRTMTGALTSVLAGAAMLLAGGTAMAQPVKTLLHSPCAAKPRYACPDAKNCDQDAKTFLGAATEPKTQRAFFLDFPCDLKPGEKVNFILNLHGAGSIGNWQRGYFPAADYTQKYRLVVATPTALTVPVGADGKPGSRVWVGDADDVYLHNIVDEVVEALGKQNVQRFWLAGHSQGGLTSRRIVCSEYFRDKVDGFLSLSGGRVGTPAVTRATGVTPPAGASVATPPPPLTCDFSFIFDIGEREAQSASATDKSEWAEKYGCQPRKRQADVVDKKAGYVTATDQTRGPAWGTTARPGTAQVYTFDGCKDGRVVADVVRMEKGHTEGLEPNITQKILDMMMSSRGGKISGG